MDITSFAVASDGALHHVAASDAQGFNQSDCGGPVSLFLDRSGATLYDEDIYSDCANNAYQFFGVGASTGDLNYLGTTARMTPEFEVPLSFVGSNKYAYGASCYHWNQVIFGFARDERWRADILRHRPRDARGGEREFLLSLFIGGGCGGSCGGAGAADEQCFVRTVGRVPACRLHGGQLRESDYEQHLRSICPRFR